MEVEGLVAALAVTSWEDRHRLKCMGLHGFVPDFMGVDVLSKLKEAMLGEINGLAGNYGSRAK